MFLACARKATDSGKTMVGFSQVPCLVGLNQDPFVLEALITLQTLNCVSSGNQKCQNFRGRQQVSLVLGVPTGQYVSCSLKLPKMELYRGSYRGY